MKKRRHIIALIILVGCINAVLAGPNVLLVVTDDQGYGDMSCHGNPDLVTPEIDHLHGESVRLTDFHVDPTCSPTRAALLTGRYATRTGVWLTYGSRHHLRRDERTMADLFKANGYRTAIFGKWHLGDNYPFRPSDRGFDESLIHGGGVIGEVPDYWDNNYYDDVYFRNDEPEKVEGYCTDVWFREAMKFAGNSGDQPFFIYLPTNAPHGPFHVPQKYVQPYLDKGVPPTRAQFYGMIASIDENLGRLRQKLDELDKSRDTLLIFLNDNGTAAGVHLKKDGKTAKDGWAASGFNAGMRGKKGTAYEGGHRAACFIHWPEGGLTGGKDVNGLSAHFDLLPTLIELCQLEVPTPIAFDGSSLADSLENPMQRIPDRTLVVHDQGRFGKPLGDGMPIKDKSFSVMRGPWRLVGSELYNIESDPGQRVDVATIHPETTASMKAAYENWWADLSPSFEEFCPFIIDPSKQETVVITSQNLLGGDVLYNQFHVRQAMPTTGWTLVDVEKNGLYRITLKRWPRELDLPMNAVAEPPVAEPSTHNLKDKFLKPSNTTHSFIKARLQVGSVEMSTDVRPSDREAAFVVELSPGEQRLGASFLNESGEYSAAYYVYIEPAS